MKPVLLRYFQYAVTSLAGAAVETLALWLLSAYAFKSGYWYEYVVSPIIAFQISVPVCYVISYYYVWKDRMSASSDSPFSSRVRQFVAYAALTTLVFVVRLGVLLVVEAAFQWDVVLCSLVAMIISGILNFIISNLWIFPSRAS